MLGSLSISPTLQFEISKESCNAIALNTVVGEEVVKTIDLNKCYPNKSFPNNKPLNRLVNKANINDLKRLLLQERMYTYI